MQIRRGVILFPSGLVQGSQSSDVCTFHQTIIKSRKQMGIQEVQAVNRQIVTRHKSAGCFKLDLLRPDAGRTLTGMWRGGEVRSGAPLC